MFVLASIAPARAAWLGVGAADFHGPIEGRACTTAGSPGPTILFADEILGEPRALRLAGDVWAEVRPRSGNVHEVVLSGVPIGMLDVNGNVWTAELNARHPDCRMASVRWTADRAAPTVAIEETAVQSSLRLERALGAALAARAQGQVRDALAALEAIEREPEAVAGIRRRALLHRARIELEIRSYRSARADLTSADALRETALFRSPLMDAFAKSLELRWRAATGDRKAAAVVMLALERDTYARLPDDDEDRLANLAYLASVRLLERDVSGAEELLSLALPAIKRLHGATDPLRTEAVAAQASLDRIEGRLLFAQDSLLPELQVAGVVRMGRNLAYAQLSIRFAINATVANHAVEAVPAATRGTAWLVEELGPENTLTIFARETLAYALGNANRVPEAIAVQRELVLSREAVSDVQDANLFVMRHNLANFLERDRRYAEAEGVLVALLQSAPPPGVRPDEIVHVKLDLAQVRWQRHGPTVACSTVQEIRASLAEGLVLPASRASDFDLLQARCVTLGSPGEGIALLRRLVGQRVELFGTDSIGVLEARSALARAEIDAGDFEDARETLQDLASAVERQRRHESPDATGAHQAFAEWLRSDALGAGNRDLAYLYALAGDAPNAIRVAESARARSLNDAIGVRRDIAGLPTRDQYRAGALAARIRELEAEIALLAPSDPARTALEVAQTDLARELDNLRQNKGAIDQSTPELDLRGVRSRLPPGSAFVGIQVVRGGVWAYVLRRGIAPKAVLLDRATPLMPALGPLRNALSSPRTSFAPIWRTSEGDYVSALTAPAPDARRQSVEGLLEDVGARLVAPLLPFLKGIVNLVVVAEAPLADFPLDALVVQGERVGVRWNMQSAPSLTVWSLRHAEMRGRQPSPLDLVAIGAPDYVAMPLIAVGPIAARSWGPLPGAADEIASVAALFPDARRITVSGPDATKKHFVALARDGTLSKTRYLHIAAHGLLAVDAPQWSSLVLTGDKGPGYVTAAEIATFDIGADLVVLSACETALGKDIAGEGLFGLPYAFAIAGARSTLLTLWPVADRPTAQFMRRYYARLARGISPGPALTQTKREFMRSKEYSAPFYWAPFVLYGT